MALRQNFFSFAVPSYNYLLLVAFLVVCLFHHGADAKLKQVEVISDSNWTAILKDEWLVKFYAPWCPACRNAEPMWKSLGEWAEMRPIRIGDVDVTEQSALSGRFMITALPTVYHIKDGEFRTYSGPRTVDDFIKYIDNEEWKNVSPVPSWKAPESYIMSFISNLFQFSVKLKDIHTALTDVYGLPVWASFVLFGVVIVMLGLLLGMVLVLMTDYFFGPPEAPLNDAEEEAADEVDTPGNADESSTDSDDDRAKDDNDGGKQKDESEEEEDKNVNEKKDADESIAPSAPVEDKESSVRKRTVAKE